MAAKTIAAITENSAASSATVAAFEVANLATVASAIVAGATARHESRGAHTRADFPERERAQRGRYVQAGSEALRFAPLHEPEIEESAA